MNWAIIKAEVVTNVIVSDYYNAHKIAGKQDSIAVLVDRYPVQGYDTWFEQL
jgi:hypothetical protein